MGADIAANPHYPVLSRAPRPASSRSASLSIGSPQNDRCDARRNDPAMVWSAPFRGPVSPEKPFIISSRASAETAALQKRWTAFQLPDRVRINSWESLRSVIELSVDFPRQTNPFSSG